MTRETDRIEIVTTPEVMNFLDEMSDTYNWSGPEVAARQLLDAACTFTETCWLERLTPDPSQ